MPRDDVFNVYIDEAGDEGFKVENGEWKSSEWFIVGALIVRDTNDLELSKCVDTIKAHLKFERQKMKPLHFIDLTHDKRNFVLHCMVTTGKFRCCYVAMNKKQMKRPEVFQKQKGLLYNYCTRFLLERVTWLIDDTDKGKTKANLIFENRSNTSFEELEHYINELQKDPEVQLRSGTINNFKVLNKGQSKNLQLADVITSSLFKGLEKNIFGLIESSYISSISKHVYQKNQKYHAYGMKFFPLASNDAKILSEYPWLNMFTKSTIQV